MKISYSTSCKPTKEMIKSCDDGVKGFQSLIVETTRMTMTWRMTAIIWILTRFYKRTITDKSIEYEFYLLKGKL